MGQVISHYDQIARLPGQRVPRPYGFACATRAMPANASWATAGYSGTGNGERTGETRHLFTHDCGSIRLCYGNWHATGGETNMGNTLVVKAGVIHPNDATKAMKVTFNGLDSVTLAAGQDVVSDPIAGLWVPAGTQVFIRSMFNPGGLGNAIPMGYTTTAADGEGGTNGDFAHVTTALSAQNSTFPAPYAILGRADTPRVSVAIIGDSITKGDNDLAVKLRGFVVIALGTSYPYVMLARSSENSNQFSYTAGLHRFQLASYCTHAVMAHGNNDFYGSARTAAAVEADQTAIGYSLLRAGCKPYLCTVTPRVTQVVATPGDWSEGNQTFSSSANTHRMNYNAWALTQTNRAPFYGCFDVAARVESLTTPGKIQAAYMDDAGAGVHPNTAGYTAMAAAVTPASFTL